MLLKTICIILICLSPLDLTACYGDFDFASARDNNNDLLKYFTENVRLPKDTNFPIDIETDKAIYIKNVTSLSIKFAAGNVIVRNRGNTVIVIPSTNNSDLITLTGGVFLKNVYVFAEIIYYWDNDYNGRALGSYDGGNGSPLHAAVVLYNRKKYGTFENCLNYRDGLAIIVIGVSVQGTRPNKRFSPFQKTLSRVEKATAQSTISFAKAFSYLNVFDFADFYYVHTGAYIIPTTGRRYFCASNVFLPRDISPAISITQFQGFPNLKNKQGTPMNVKVTSFPQQDTILVQALGIVTKSAEVLRI